VSKLTEQAKAEAEAIGGRRRNAGITLRGCQYICG
jgi:hypothetical protein